MLPIILIASGDLRLKANQKCWPAQQKVEELVSAAIQRDGFKAVRGHAFDPIKQGGEAERGSSLCSTTTR